jgi:hypothetical protein
MIGETILKLNTSPFATVWYKLVRTKPHSSAYSSLISTLNTPFRRNIDIMHTFWWRTYGLVLGANTTIIFPYPRNNNVVRLTSVWMRVGEVQCKIIGQYKTIGAQLVYVAIDNVYSFQMEYWMWESVQHRQSYGAIFISTLTNVQQKGRR